MENIFIEFLPPWVETGLQPAFYDKESGTVLQQISRMYPKINELIKSNNELGKEFVKLHDYVHDYFDNLDVQEEVNNKLDDMAESGDLATIIAQFLEMSPVFAYHTISEMAGADNLADGCIAKVLGKTNADTGDGSFYKIRTRIPADVPDGTNLVAITGDDTIIAQIIPEYYYNTLNSAVSNIDSRVTHLEAKKHLVIIGDSFSTITYCDEDASWYKIFADKTNYTYHNYARNSAGFVHVGSGASTFLTQANQAIADTTYDNDDVDMVIVYGGLNDMNTTDISSLTSAATSLFNTLNANFTNAKIVFAGINCWRSGCWNNGGYNQMNYFDFIKIATRNLGLIYVNTTYWLFTNDDENYNTSNNHPNELGNAVFASNMLNTLFGSPLAVSKAGLAQLTNTPTTGSGTIEYRINNNTILANYNITTDSEGLATFTMAKNISGFAYGNASYISIAGVNKVGYINKNNSTMVYTLHGEASTTYYGSIEIPLV